MIARNTMNITVRPTVRFELLSFINLRLFIYDANYDLRLLNKRGPLMLLLRGFDHQMLIV